MLHLLEIRAVRPTTTVNRSKYGVDLVILPNTLGYYLGCRDCDVADPTTHDTKDLAVRTSWRHP